MLHVMGTLELLYIPDPEFNCLKILMTDSLTCIDHELQQFEFFNSDSPGFIRYTRFSAFQICTEIPELMSTEPKILSPQLSKQRIMTC